MLLVLLLELVFIKRKQIQLQKGSDSSLSPPSPQKAKWGQLEQILCLALLTAQISSERSIPPLGRVRPGLKAASATPSPGTVPRPLRVSQC